MSSSRIDALRSKLLAWFGANARDLPWRRTRDPYAIWVSEVMLQQTRVETVIPYFHRFVARFPNPASLAGAPLDDVLSEWSGLGYYKRARVLHLAAREVTERYGGELPKDAEGLRSLPGIGAYTAGAIASIAFGERAAIVDGNVARVISRLEGYEDAPGSAALKKKLWDRAAELASGDEPGKLNESLMELGATVCTPRSPRCDACPVASLCVAKEAGKQAEIGGPVAREKKIPTVKMTALLAARDNNEVLLGRREEGGLFGGLWEAPMVEAASSTVARGAFERIGIEVRGKLARAGRVLHVLSHRALDVAIVRAESEVALREPQSPYVRFSYEKPRGGVSSLARKVLKAL